MRILVVDDADDIVQILKFILVKDGHQVDVAADGASALGKAKETAFDVMLVDYNLPDKTGPELVKEIRAIVQNPLRAILITGLADEKVIAQIKEMGLDGYVAKPFHADEIRKVIQSI